MLLDCTVSVTTPGCQPRPAKARVGVGSSNGIYYILVRTGQDKNKWRVNDVSNVFQPKSKAFLTISFSRPAKDVVIRSPDNLSLASLASLLAKIRSGTDLVSKLPQMETLEKEKVQPSILSVKGNNFIVQQLSNQSLRKAIFEATKLLPKGLWKLSNLSELHLIRCNLTEIPERLTLLGNTLVFLNLSHNEISQVTAQFCLGMKALSNLNMSHNQIPYIPLEIALLKNLVVLDFGWNRVRRLPFTLNALRKLKDLIVCNNSLSYLPMYFVHHKNHGVRLFKFDVSNNSSVPFNGNSASLDSQELPSLLDRSASSSLRSLANFNLLHASVPRTVYSYIQMNSNICQKCRKPVVGANYFKDIVSNYDLSSFATTLISDNSTKLSLVSFYCWFCYFSAKL